MNIMTTPFFTEPLIAGYLTAIVFILGCVLGSFVNCWAWRYTHGESILSTHSHCTTCGHELGIRDLVPLLSWALSRGRCRYCGEHVSWRYPVTELVSGLVYVAILWHCLAAYDPVEYAALNTGALALADVESRALMLRALETVELMAFASTLLFLSLTDLDEQIIPNASIVVAVLIRVAYLVGVWLVTGAFPTALLVASAIGGFGVALVLLAVVLIMDRVLGRDSMGGGDLKLFFVAGLYFGWQQCILLVIVSCVLGIVFGLAAAPAGGADGDAAGARASLQTTPFAFGPAIAVACVLTMFCGEGIVSWYLSLF